MSARRLFLNFDVHKLVLCWGAYFVCCPAGAVPP